MLPSGPHNGAAAIMPLPAPFIGHARPLENGDTLFLILNADLEQRTLNAPDYGIAGLAFGGHQQRSLLASDPTIDAFEGL